MRFNWNSAINIDPFDNSTIYFGSQYVHKSTDKGLTWEVISPDLTTNDPEKQKQSESGGLTMDATGAENHTTILVIEPSPAQKNMIWTGSDDGKVFYTRNGGEDWTDVSKNIKYVCIKSNQSSGKPKGIKVFDNAYTDDSTDVIGLISEAQYNSSLPDNSSSGWCVIPCTITNPTTTTASTHFLRV